MPVISLHGHQTVTKLLRSAHEAGKLPHSVLLHGPAGVGKQRLALDFARSLLCSRPNAPCDACQDCRFTADLSHPDLHWFFPQPRPKDSDSTPDEVKSDMRDAVRERIAAGLLYAPPSGSDGLFISTSRAIAREASLSPALGKCKVFVIGDAERMVPQEGADFAANAFLKLLEEPPENTWFLLTSSEPGALLPTIRSRVSAIRMGRLTPSEMSGFVDDPVVADLARDLVGKLRRDPLGLNAFLESGCPGSLFAAADVSAALEAARGLIAAARDARPDALIEAAFAFGDTGARGTFSDVLDAVSRLLVDEIRLSVSSSADGQAARVSALVLLIEDAKVMAASNVSPRLIASRVASQIRQAAA